MCGQSTQDRERPRPFGGVRQVDRFLQQVVGVHVPPAADDPRGPEGQALERARALPVSRSRSTNSAGSSRRFSVFPLVVSCRVAMPSATSCPARTCAVMNRPSAAQSPGFRPGACTGGERAKLDDAAGTGREQPIEKCPGAHRGHRSRGSGRQRMAQREHSISSVSGSYSRRSDSAAPRAVEVGHVADGRTLAGCGTCGGHRIPFRDRSRA